MTTRSIAADSAHGGGVHERAARARRQDGAAARAVARSDQDRDRRDPRPCRRRGACPSPVTIPPCMRPWRRRAARRATCSRRSSRRGSRRSAPSACKAWRRISPPAWSSATSGAASRKSTDRSEAPLPDALALLVRETLTGQAPPAKARAVVNLWRPWIEGRARTVLDRMPEMLFDQEAFGRLTRDLLAALNLADQLDQREDETSPRRARPTPTRRMARKTRPKASSGPILPPIPAPTRTP